MYFTICWIENSTILLKEKSMINKKAFNTSSMHLIFVIIFIDNQKENTPPQ